MSTFRDQESPISEGAGQDEGVLRNLLEHLPLRIFYKDLDSTYVTCNGAFASDHGISAREIAGKTDFDLLPDELARRNRDEDQRVIANGELHENECEYPVAGEHRHIHAIKSPVRDDNGCITGLLGVYWDITQRVAKQSALQESEQHFRGLFERSKAVQLLIDPKDGRIVNANRAAEQYYGYDRDTLLAMSIKDINTLTPDQVQQEMARARSEQRDHFFFRHRLANGEIRDVEVHSGPLDINDHHLLYSIIHDITDRRRAEQRLRASEENYRNLAESVTSEYLLYRHDTDGNFTYVSPSIENIVGYPPQEFASNYQSLLTANPINRLAVEYTNRAIAGQRQPPYEVEILTRDRRTRRLRLSESPLFDESGNVIAIQGIGADITEAWRSAMQLRTRNLIMEMINRVCDENAILDTLVKHVEELYPDARCSILRLDQQHQTLHTLSAPRLPEIFIKAMEGVRIGEGVSASGTAAARREPVICEDILEHPYWADFREAASNSGLRACWSHPIMGRGNLVLGTFAMYYPEPRTPHASEMKQIADAAKLASVVIESVRAEQTLRQAEERQRLLLNSSTEGIFGVDLESRTSFVNPAAARMLGYSVKELQGKAIHSLIHHTDAQGKPIPLPQCRICSGEIAEPHHHSEEEILWRKDGSHFPVEYWRNPIMHEGRMVGSVVTFHDITERRAYEARIEHLAFHDPLTGLPNRTHLLERLTMASAHAARHAEPYAFHLLDLDFFKEVNDNYGHPVGDKLLIRVSRRILSILRADDTLARLGGDEFCLIQSAVPDQTQATALAERIIERLAAPFDIEGHEIRIGVSIGITLIEGDTTPQERIFEQADDALYQAKRGGRNRVEVFAG